MSIADRDVTRFATLFSGYEKARGVFTPTKKGPNGKVQGRVATLRGGADFTHFQEHLNGGTGLGIIMLRDDDTVLFGAIDYDRRDMDHAKAEAKVKELGLPLVLCRSKSGGGHFYCFLTDPLPADEMRDRLDEWRALLGMAPSTEIFPKQDCRANDDDVGSWINLPYYGAEDTSRYAILDGQPASLEAFLDAAEAARVDPDVLAKSWIADTTLFPEGPPCLQTLEAQGGFSEGGKKNGMFDVGVYLRKAHPDDWESRFDSYNATMAGLTSSEVQGLIKQLRKKNYSYQCKQPPINSVCQRRLCLQRQYGIGEGDPEQQGVMIGGITRYESAHGEEPLWAMEVNGKRMMITTQQLYSRDEFNRAAISQVNLVPVHMTPARWLKYLNNMIATAEIVAMPDDASPTGQLWERVVMFLTQQADAKDRAEILTGKPYRGADGRVYFRSLDLFAYLDARRAQYRSPQHVWQILRDRGAEKGFWNIKGAGVNWWSIPSPVVAEVPSEDEAPVIEQSEEF